MSMTLPATAHQAGGLLQGELKPEEEDEPWSFGCWEVDGCGMSEGMISPPLPQKDATLGK